MKYLLITDTPQFFSDICEVIRLYHPDAEIFMDPDSPADYHLIHRHLVLDSGSAQNSAATATDTDSPFDSSLYFANGSRPVTEETTLPSEGLWQETWSLFTVPAEVTAAAECNGTREDTKPVCQYTLTWDAVYGGLQETRELKRAAKTGCFLLMRKMAGWTPPWGSLTGIRPTRLLTEAIESGLETEEAKQWLQKRFFVSPSKTDLLADILRMQGDAAKTPPDTYDVYCGIPFCVTRCAYCSFSSGELGDGHLVEPYLDALIHEMQACSETLRMLGKTPRAFYMGGGTPTSLTAPQLHRLLQEARRLFPECVEWTVEAGRPDTIDREKLETIRDLGIGRISVNPQTFSDETLKRIGRSHTARQTLDAYQLARETGFDSINMDLICALPEETPEDFERSLNTTISLKPENITVHTLAIKRSSKLHEIGYHQADAASAEYMVNMARERLHDAGYYPYYLYRQKYMAGNLENVGYAIPGKVCLYNIGNMEEIANVLALGAGGITKWLFPGERRIERAPNVKNIEQYIQRVDEMILRKTQLIAGTGVS